MIRALVLALLVALPAAAEERQVPFTCPIGWHDHWADTPTERVSEATQVPGCTFEHMDDERAEWRFEIDAAGRLHTFQWPTPDGEDIALYAQSKNMTLPVVAGNTYRVDIVWRESPEIIDNDAYINVWCWEAGLSESFYPSPIRTDTWPARWTATVTEDCLISVAVWCGQLATDPTRGECHNDAVAFEITPPPPTSRCGMGPELVGLAAFLPVLRWRRRRTLRGGQN